MKPTTKLRIALLGSVLAGPIAAKAQPIEGLYIGAGAGGNYRASQDFTGFSAVINHPPNAFTPLTRTVPNGSIPGTWGFVGLGRIGWGFGNGLRVEIEGNYRHNDVRSVTGTAFPTHGHGTIETYGGMANVLYDFDLGPYGVPLLPYAGVGVGYAWTSLRGLSATGTNFPDLLRSNATGSNFAYQVIGGLAFPVPNVPGLAITAEYRFFSVIGSERFDASYIVPPPRGFGENFGKLKFPAQYNHAALLGVRYAFNAAAPLPPPAPVQAPAPAPARSYLVFFDWDRADLTDRARQIIAEAAQNSTRVQYTRIQVNGYTDTSGTPAYNQRLSVRRAESVAAELVRDGVPRSAISIQGFGETHLLVPTGPGVREPQNRRVAIIIQ